MLVNKLVQRWKDIRALNWRSSARSELDFFDGAEVEVAVENARRYQEGKMAMKRGATACGSCWAA